jgi:hypothetical protein
MLTARRAPSDHHHNVAIKDLFGRKVVLRVCLLSFASSCCLFASYGTVHRKWRPHQLDGATRRLERKVLPSFSSVTYAPKPAAAGLRPASAASAEPLPTSRPVSAVSKSKPNCLAWAGSGEWDTRGLVPAGGWVWANPSDPSISGYAWVDNKNGHRWSERSHVRSWGSASDADASGSASDADSDCEGVMDPALSIAFCECSSSSSIATKNLMTLSELCPRVDGSSHIRELYMEELRLHQRLPISGGLSKEQYMVGSGCAPPHPDCPGCWQECKANLGPCHRNFPNSNVLDPRKNTIPARPPSASSPDFRPRVDVLRSMRRLSERGGLGTVRGKRLQASARVGSKSKTVHY